MLLTLSAFGSTGRASDAAQPAVPNLDPRLWGEPQVHPRWRSCDNEPSAQRQFTQSDVLTMPQLADTFRPVAAVICGREPQRRPDGGADLVATEDRVSDMAALLTALRLPDDLPQPFDDDDSADIACNRMLVLPPWLALLDAAGRWIRPGLPREACGGPRAEVMKAIEGAPRNRISTRVLQEVESAEAAVTGCGDEWADMVWVTGADGAARPAVDLADLPFDGALVNVCVYRVPADERGGDKPRGEIVSRELLPEGRWPVVKRRIKAAGPVRACDTPASRFALLMPGEIYVELDGCRRVLARGTGSDALRQAPADLPDLLTKR
ncbi:hypothetical protein ACIBSW_06245 [Actinoplanes sp. NPDC049668]|uniref:hypothetical protein n=1 Tax=unclassified Actinoplanes TaxID=2626549 RepID=UPI0033B4C23A